MFKSKKTIILAMTVMLTISACGIQGDLTRPSDIKHEDKTTTD